MNKWINVKYVPIVERNRIYNIIFSLVYYQYTLKCVTLKYFVDCKVLCSISSGSLLQISKKDLMKEHESCLREKVVSIILFQVFMIYKSNICLLVATHCTTTCWVVWKISPLICSDFLFGYLTYRYLSWSRNVNIWNCFYILSIYLAQITDDAFRDQLRKLLQVKEVNTIPKFIKSIFMHILELHPLKSTLLSTTVYLPLTA